MHSFSEAILSGLLLGLFIALSVGPTLFAVIRYSMHHSYKAGIAFILGVSISDILYVLLANLASGWLVFLEEQQDIVGYVGSGLFIGMGLYALLKKYIPRRPRRGKELNITAGTYFKLWASGFLMNTLNPAVVLLWVGAAIKATNSEYDLLHRFLFFGVCLGMVLIADVLKVLLADRIRNWLTLRKIMYLNKTSAVFILLFGLLLLAKVFFQVKLG